MISKRELTDLRQSITKTLYGLKNPASKHPASIQTKKRLCFNCGLFYEPAAAHQCKTAHKHSNAPQVYSGIDRHIQENRFECRLCGEKHNHAPALHDAELCGERRLACENCGAKIKRKDLEDHIVRCCFHDCPQCKKLVYHQVYAYHTNRCSIEGATAKHTADMSRTRKIGKRQPI